MCKPTIPIIRCTRASSKGTSFSPEFCCATRKSTLIGSTFSSTLNTFMTETIRSASNSLITLCAVCGFTGKTACSDLLASPVILMPYLADAIFNTAEVNINVFFTKCIGSLGRK